MISFTARMIVDTIIYGHVALICLQTRVTVYPQRVINSCMRSEPIPKEILIQYNFARTRDYISLNKTLLHSISINGRDIWKNSEFENIIFEEILRKRRIITWIFYAPLRANLYKIPVRIQKWMRNSMLQRKVFNLLEFWEAFLDACFLNELLNINADLRCYFHLLLW